MAVAVFFLHFNPRSPHGERQLRLFFVQPMTKFQPTLPARGATGKSVDLVTLDAISTHAPRTGSDRNPARHKRGAGHFNPRSPHGERQCLTSSCPSPMDEFQPTLPARGATGNRHREVRGGEFQPTLPARGATELAVSAGTLVWIISTHAPRTGSDVRALQFHPCY